MIKRLCDTGNSGFDDDISSCLRKPAFHSYGGRYSREIRKLFDRRGQFQPSGFYRRQSFFKPIRQPT
jgi:hypothetical protein